MFLIVKADPAAANGAKGAGADASARCGARDVDAGGVEAAVVAALGSSR